MKKHEKCAPAWPAHEEGPGGERIRWAFPTGALVSIDPVWAGHLRSKLSSLFPLVIVTFRPEVLKSLYFSGISEKVPEAGILGSLSGAPPASLPPLPAP